MSLDSCINLISLNLSSNSLTTLGAGLKTLLKLERLDVSNNKLKAIDNSLFGLPSLEFLALSGNDLSDVADLNNLHIVSTSLTSLYYQSSTNADADGALTNPVCLKEGYYETATAVLLNLRVLDGESVGLREVWSQLGVGETIEPDPKLLRDLETEDWLADVSDELGEGGVGGDDVLNTEDVKATVTVLREILAETNAEMGRAKAVLKGTDAELTRLHLL